MRLSGPGQGEVVGFCEHGNEPPDSLRWGLVLNSKY